MSTQPPIFSGLRQLADRYDALVCDVWGVIHNGVQAFPASCEALVRYRAEVGPVVLLSNAPRLVQDLKAQFARLAVPENCYDSIVTSGVAARRDLVVRSANGELPIYHLGPERDRGIFEGLPVISTEIASAAVVLCTGLFDDDVETPDDYTGTLAEIRKRDLAMLCANPDIVVQRGDKLCYCAGALARAYETVGGRVVFYGKPHRPIYDLVLESLKGARRPLAIGDGLATDIKGANGAGIDALFIADGIHAKETEPFTPSHLRTLFNREKLSVIGAMRTLVW